MLKVKITATNIEYPFIRMENIWQPLEQKYVYEDNGEQQIPVSEATVIEV